MISLKGFRNRRFLSQNLKSLIIISLLFIIKTSLHGQNLDPKKIKDKCLGAVVSIYHYDGGGTGFLINKSGYILTNYHVIKGASRNDLLISFADSSSYSCDKIVNYDRDLDIAILKIQLFADKIALPILDSADAQSAEDVVAIGCPKGEDFSINKGSVSNTTSRILPDYLQTDVTINPGNSGGPLINKNGLVVGMVTYKRYDAEGMGYALKASKIKEFLDYNYIDYLTYPLIDDLELFTRELTEEEKEKLKEKELERIELEREQERRKRFAEMVLDSLNVEQRKELSESNLNMKKRNS